MIRRLACLTALGLVPISCGTSADDVFSSGAQTTAASGAGASSSATGSGGASTTTTTSSSATGAGPVGAGGATGSGGGTVSGSSSSSASSSAVSSSSSSGTGGATFTTISCDVHTCPYGSQNACCWDKQFLSGQCVQGPPDNDGCFTDQISRQTRIECEFPEQCNTNVCCAHRVFTSDTSSYYDVVSCQQDCSYPDIMLCDPAMVGYCPVIQVNGMNVQTTCKPSTLLPPGYTVCGP